jgi:hypothetical protein
MGYDQTGCIVLSYRGSADGKLKSEALDPLELIRRWLLNALCSRRAQSGNSASIPPLWLSQSRCARRTRKLDGASHRRRSIKARSAPRDSFFTPRPQLSTVRADAFAEQNETDVQDDDTDAYTWGELAAA